MAAQLPPSPTQTPGTRSRWAGLSAPFIIGAIGAIVLAALLIVPVFMRGFMRDGEPGPAIGAGPGFLVPLLLLAGLVWLVLWAVPRLTGRDTALQLLRERYARGEVSEDDYARMLETLRR